MKRKIIYLLLCVIIAGTSCSASKDAQERRNLMIPKKDELPKNKKYTATSKRKTYAIKGQKKKKRNKKY